MRDTRRIRVLVKVRYFAHGSINLDGLHSSRFTDADHLQILHHDNKEQQQSQLHSFKTDYFPKLGSSLVLATVYNRSDGACLLQPPAIPPPLEIRNRLQVDPSYSAPLNCIVRLENQEIKDVEILLFPRKREDHACVSSLFIPLRVSS